ncbi:TM1802 family CRISPR-associated protein [Fervidobacterium thailandense]|uniref:TM1802 family CRISPR-associated protein n=1 Tax=Fervidobacterium thailandense TaxID=1008305 RepID=UPI0013017AAF
MADYVELSVLGDDVKQYVETLKLNEQELGLFLLGMLVSFVAKEQAKKGDGKKVILEKINYYGMPLTKVLSFANEIFEKLIQYKVLNSYTELIHSLAKSYLDKNLKDWKLTPQENVYWIKSGYAYQTKKFILSSNSKED